MNFCDQIIDATGWILLFTENTCVNCIPCIWMEKDPTGIRYKNVFGQINVIDTEKYTHIAFKKEGAINSEDIILLK